MSKSKKIIISIVVACFIVIAVICTASLNTGHTFAVSEEPTINTTKETTCATEKKEANTEPTEIQRTKKEVETIGKEKDDSETKNNNSSFKNSNSNSSGKNQQEEIVTTHNDAGVSNEERYYEHYEYVEEYEPPQEDNSDCEASDSYSYDYNLSYPSISYSDIPSFKDGDVAAYLTIPEMGLYRVPIVYGITQELCDNNDIVMHPASSVFGNGRSVTICGHNYNALGCIPSISSGCEMYVETVYGANYHYRVYYSKYSGINQDNNSFQYFYDIDTGETLPGIGNAGDYLVLMTCYGNDLNYRWLVIGKMVEGSKIL